MPEPVAGNGSVAVLHGQDGLPGKPGRFILTG